MTFKNVLSILSRHVLFILTLTALVVVPTAYFSLRQPDRFRATALLQVLPPLGTAVGIQETIAARERAVTISKLANTGVVHIRAARGLPRTVAPYACGFSLMEEQSEFIVASCSSEQQDQVAPLANRHAAALQALLDDQRERRTAQMRSRYRAQIRQLRALGVSPDNFPVQPIYPSREIQITRFADPPAEPYAPNHLRTILIALALGLLINSALAILLEYAQDKAREIEDFEQALGEPILATIPAIRRSGNLPAERAQPPGGERAAGLRTLPSNGREAGRAGPVERLPERGRPPRERGRP